MRRLLMLVALVGCGTEDDALRHLQLRGYTKVRFLDKPVTPGAQCLGSQYGFVGTQPDGQEILSNVCCGPRSCDVHR